MTDAARPGPRAGRAPVGTSLFVIAPGHLTLGAVRHRTVFAGMLREGWVGSLERPGLATTSALQRQQAFWFETTGVGLLLLGVQTALLERRGQRPPRQVGAALAALAVVGGAAVPASGFWALLLPAALVSRRQDGRWTFTDLTTRPGALGS